MAISALLFDCDGVIADTEPDGHRPAFNAAFKEKGFSDVWTKEHYGELLETGGGKERMTAHWNEVGWPAGYEDAESQQALVKELHLRKTAIFNEMITKGEIPIRKGVLNLIDEALADGVPVGACSYVRRAGRGRTWSVLMGDARADKIPIYAGDVVKKKKPSPRRASAGRGEDGIGARQVRRHRGLVHRPGRRQGGGHERHRDEVVVRLPGGLRPLRSGGQGRRRTPRGRRRERFEDGGRCAREGVLFTPGVSRAPKSLVCVARASMRCGRRAFVRTGFEPFAAPCSFWHCCSCSRGAFDTVVV